MAAAAANAAPTPCVSWPAGPGRRLAGRVRWRPRRAGGWPATEPSPGCWSAGSWSAASPPPPAAATSTQRPHPRPRRLRRPPPPRPHQRPRVGRAAPGGRGRVAPGPGWGARPAAGCGPHHPSRPARPTHRPGRARRRLWFPDCHRPLAWCEGHHLDHWLDGGPTDLDNLILLCRAHHRAVHEGGWRPTRQPDGRRTAIPPHRPHRRQPHRRHRVAA
jgi:hypothetical protein